MMMITDEGYEFAQGGILDQPVTLYGDTSEEYISVAAVKEAILKMDLLLLELEDALERAGDITIQLGNKLDEI